MIDIGGRHRPQGQGIAHCLVILGDVARRAGFNRPAADTNPILHGKFKRGRDAMLIERRSTPDAGDAMSRPRARLRRNRHVVIVIGVAPFDIIRPSGPGRTMRRKST